MLLTDLFLANATRHAGRVAIDVPPGSARQARQLVTYEQLTAMAASVCRTLHDRVHGESTVVVLLSRETPWFYAAQLGVMMAGAAHVCLDASFPDAHLEHVVRDAAAVAILTDAAGSDRFVGCDAPVIRVPLDVPADAELGSHGIDQPSWLSPSSLAYLIYTSGTTGVPKGVLLEHRGVVNLVRQGVARFGIQPGDRIAQGSSAAYDSSVEEIWLALGGGATVVVLDDEAVRLGPDLAAWLRQERITVLCPPPTLLRAMDCRSPSDELPALRLCYVGGEPLSSDLADLWGGEIWLENGYGPTECTVTVVRGRVHPGEPVTIGVPVPPHVAHVLDERLRPVTPGESGELCIAGPGLARGYLGLADRTAQGFPTIDGIGRVYRTGDLVVADADGRLRYLGRIDAQVKVRGYRIELEAIEAVLARCEGVREAVCAARGEEPERTLVAHVVPRDPGSPPRFDALREAVASQLPAYMVPAHLALLDEVPRTVGGKIDRKALPVIESVSAVQLDDDGDGSIIGRVRSGFAAVLGMASAQIDADADFFDHGGNSLRAALLVSRLRRLGGLESVAVRDVYRAPSIAALADVLAERGSQEAVVPLPGASRTRPASAVAGFTLVQIAFLLGLLLVGSAAVYVLAYVLTPWLFATFSLATILFALPWITPLVAIVVGAVMLWLAVAAKELLIGQYRPMRISAWSSFHLRHWVVSGIARLVPWSLLAGTELQSAALRALGARVGRRVHFHRGVDVFGGGWDLLEIGDDVSLGREVDLGTCELDDGQLVVGPVRIGSGATLETRSGTASDVEVGAGAIVRPLSFVPAGARVPAGEVWDGVPAQSRGPAPTARELDEGRRQWSMRRYTATVLALNLFVLPLLAMPMAAVTWCVLTWLGIDSEAILNWAWWDGPSSNLLWFVALVLLSVLAVPIALVELALLLRWLPKTPAGTHARWSLCYWWLATRTGWLERAGNWLAGTLFWPWWLRLAGMRVDRDVEVSTILDVLPEHVSIGAHTFLADGVYLGVPHVHQGRVTVAAASLGNETFVGNHVIVEGGQHMPDDVLLGISTVADARTMPSGTSWFGHPAFALPQREVIEVDRALTHTPGPLRYANRLFWESLRVLLPALPVALGLWWFDLVTAASWIGAGAAWFTVVWASCALALVLALVVLLAKWLLLGRVRPGQHGLWSCWASRWDFHYVMWQRYAQPVLQPLEGTLLLPWYLRAMGMRIGRRCVLGDGFAQVVDPDMITIEDGATAHALFQAHSFEDRVLKIDRVRLGAGSTVGKAAVVLYGADIGEGCYVMPHSVVMKQEALLPGRRYAGAPTAEIAPSSDADVVLPRVEANGAAAPHRDQALDVARGLAVLGMVWLHFVPAPEAAATGLLPQLLRLSLDAIEGLPAALFLLLVGTTFVAGGAGQARYVARRSLALVAIGLPFWWFVWPNDILLPIGLMLPMLFVARQIGRGAIVAALTLLLVGVPFALGWWGEYIYYDCLEDGLHVANREFGVVTLRYLLFDGAYPLLPWLALPLLGALLETAREQPARLRRWLWLAVPMPFAALAVDTLSDSGNRDLGGLEAHFAVTWQPTSLPFVLLWGGLALVVVAGLCRYSQRRGLPAWLLPMAAVGRASLTHYLGHIVLVFASMRWWWPLEDWSVMVGLVVAIGYALVALVGSAWWFGRFRRGPLEGSLHLLSGPRRS